MAIETYLRIFVALIGVAFLVLCIYVVRHVPRRYRRFGLGHIEQFHAHRIGVFGRPYEEELIPADAARVGRNDPCPCGSGKKYKKCHESRPVG